MRCRIEGSIECESEGDAGSVGVAYGPIFAKVDLVVKLCVFWLECI